MTEPAPRVVGVCVLTSRALADRLREAPGVRLAAPLMTANLGIEALVRSVLRGPEIRVLVVCGRDSPLFRQGQSLVALARNGVHGPRQRIVGAAGHHPNLRGLRRAEVEAFRARVRVVDLRGVTDPDLVRARVAEEARAAGASSGRRTRQPSEPRFATVPTGGRRRPVATAGGGFFVVSVDTARRQVLLRHYRDDFAAAHEMRGRRAEPMVLGLVGAGLLDDSAHAAYLGAELTKAETALRLGLDYVQDIPLRHAAEREDVMTPPATLREFTRLVADLLEVDALVPDRPLGEQSAADSARMIELAIALEQEHGVDLSDDVDLRLATPAELYAARDAQEALGA